jgi:hypothetical protein
VVRLARFGSIRRLFQTYDCSEVQGIRAYGGRRSIRERRDAPQ